MIVLTFAAAWPQKPFCLLHWYGQDLKSIPGSFLLPHHLRPFIRNLTSYYINSLSNLTKKVLKNNNVTTVTYGCERHAKVVEWALCKHHHLSYPANVSSKVVNLSYNLEYACVSSLVPDQNKTFNRVKQTLSANIDCKHSLKCLI